MLPEYQFTFLTKEKDELKHYERLSTDLKYFYYHLACESLMGDRTLFKPSRGFEVMCEYIIAMLDGEITRLAIAIPPRNGKSQLITTALPMFEWVSNPLNTFISVAHHNDLLTHFQAGRQSIYNNPEYQKIIDWTLTTNTKDELYNNSSGHVLSMVLDFVKTGLGAANILVDDPIPARNSDNLKACEKAWKLFTNTLLSRLNNKETGNICVVSQRLCEADIVGRVMEAGYTTLTLQAIADEPQVIIYPLSGVEWVRDKGDILNPALESLETLMEIKRTDEDTFNSQYQQRPSATKGGVIDSKNFGKYLQPQDRYQEIVLSVDSASSLSDKAANWGLTIWGKYQVHGFNHLDLLYSVAQKYDYVGGLEKIRQLIKDKGVTLTLIENKSTGLALIPQLKSEGYNVGLIQPVKSKQDRGNSAAPFCNSGRLLIPDTSHLPFTERWLSLFIYEMDGFGSGARKCDLFDSTTQVVNYYNGGGFNVRNFYRLA